MERTVSTVPALNNNYRRGTQKGFPIEFLLLVEFCVVPTGANKR